MNSIVVHPSKKVIFYDLTSVINVRNFMGRLHHAKNPSVAYYDALKRVSVSEKNMYHELPTFFDTPEVTRLLHFVKQMSKSSHILVKYQKYECNPNHVVKCIGLYDTGLSVTEKPTHIGVLSLSQENVKGAIQDFHIEDTMISRQLYSKYFWIFSSDVKYHLGDIESCEPHEPAVVHLLFFYAFPSLELF